MTRANVCKPYVCYWAKQWSQKCQTTTFAWSLYLSHRVVITGINEASAGPVSDKHPYKLLIENRMSSQICWLYTGQSANNLKSNHLFLLPMRLPVTGWSEKHNVSTKSALLVSPLSLLYRRVLKALIVSETSPHKERPAGSITITRIDVSLSTQWSLNKNQIAFSSLGWIPPTTDSLHIFFTILIFFSSFFRL